MTKYMILIFVFGLCSANYIVNGDFEQDFSVGWTIDTIGVNGWWNRSTGYDPDPDYEAYVQKISANGYVMIYQIVDVPATHLDFSVHAKLWAFDNNTSTWAAAAIVISYMNSLDTILGETKICYISDNCPWVNTPTNHLIIETDTSSWHDYAFNINDELTNLPAVNPLAISKIRISLLLTSAYC